MHTLDSSERTKWSVAALYGLVGAARGRRADHGVRVAGRHFAARRTCRSASAVRPTVSRPSRTRSTRRIRRRSRSSTSTRATMRSRRSSRASCTARSCSTDRRCWSRPRPSPAAAQALRGVAAQLQSQISETAQAALIAQLQQLGAALASGQPPATPPAAGRCARRDPAGHGDGRRAAGRLRPDRRRTRRGRASL